MDALSKFTQDYDWPLQDALEDENGLLKTVSCILRNEDQKDPNILLQQVSASQIVQAIGNKTRYPLHHTRALSKYNSLIASACHWIELRKHEFSKEMGELTFSLSVLRNLLSFLQSVTHGEESFCLFLLSESRQETALVELLDPFTSPWINRFALHVMSALLKAREENSITMSKPVLTVYASRLKPVIGKCESLITVSEFFCPLLFLLVGLLDRDHHPKWHLNLISECVNDLSTIKRCTDWLFKQKIERKLKNAVLQLLINVLSIHALWKIHLYLCGRDDLVQQLYRWFNHKRSSTRLLSLTCFAKLLAVPCPGFVEKSFKIVGISDKLLQVMRLNACNTPTNTDDTADEEEDQTDPKRSKETHALHAIYTILTTACCQGSIEVLEEMIEIDLVSEMFLFLSAHRNKCFCELMPQAVFPLIERLLATSLFKQTEAMHDATKYLLSELEHLDEACFIKYRRRAKLLSERYFYHDCLYNG